MTVDEVETHWLSSQEKVFGKVLSREGHADSRLVDERTHRY